MTVTRVAQLNPDQVLDADRFMDYEVRGPGSDCAKRILDIINRPHMKICDIGGASGVLLAAVIRRSKHPVQGTIVEVNADYRSKLVRDDIIFRHASILNNDLPSNAYDIVTFRHILHHLVCDSVRETLDAQQRALAEMLRLTKPGGYLVFEEEVNRVGLFSRLIYHLSKFTNRYGIHWRYFDIGQVVVSFMTPAQIRGALDEIDTPYTLVEHKYTSWRLGWRWRLTLLHSRVGHVLYVLRKQTLTPRVPA